jgi:hypothetical protein
VAIAVVGAAAVDRVVTAHCAATEFVMAEVNAGVDDVCSDAASGVVVGVGAAQWKRPLVNAVDTPCGGGLRRLRAGDSVRLYAEHASVAEQPGASGFRHSTGKTAENGRIHEVGLDCMRSGHISGACVIAERNDEAAGDDLCLSRGSYEFCVVRSEQWCGGIGSVGASIHPQNYRTEQSKLQLH